MQIDGNPRLDANAGLAPSRRMRRKFLREVAESGLAAEPGLHETVSETEVEALGPVAQRYLRFMGVVAGPRRWSLRLHAEGRFRLAPDRPWMPCEAWQYNSRLEIARIFHMRLRYGGLVPMLVRDTYLHGCGRMQARLLDAIPVVDETNGEIATGELVTYLNDAILFAPSMLLGPSATWADVDEGSFDVTLRDHAMSVTGRVFVDERGAVTDFHTTDRYGTDPSRPGRMVRARWSTPVRGWRVLEGHPAPSGGTAIWHFPSGDFAYADFMFTSLELDVPPTVSILREWPPPLARAGVGRHQSRRERNRAVRIPPNG